MTSLYFAYGSNLDGVQMARRCPGSRFYARASLADHCLAFPRGCESWNGAVCGIEPAEHATVHGVIYEVTPQDLANLDEYEGVADGEYTRQRINVQSDAGEAVEVWTYFANREADCDGRPSCRYLDAILRGAREHGLPQAYIDELARTPTCD